MKKYTLTYENVIQHRHEVEAESVEEALRLFDKNESVCVHTIEKWNTTDIEEVKE